MGKQYYCDYCEKSFADNANNRKNHLKGVHHHRMRKLHYDSFRDASVILSEERAKKPCLHFQQSGNCGFGANCRYSHLTPERLQELEHQAMTERERGKMAKRKHLDGPVPTVETWLAKRKKPVTEKSEELQTEKKVVLPVYHLPGYLQNIANLPPSLLPPMPDALDGLPAEDWG